MSHNYSPSEIREFVLAALNRLSRSEIDREELEEVLLIRDGTYTGRSYRHRGWMVNWMVTVGLVAFYNPRGDLVKTVDLHEQIAAESPVRRAA